MKKIIAVLLVLSLSFLCACSNRSPAIYSPSASYSQPSYSPSASPSKTPSYSPSPSPSDKYGLDMQYYDEGQYKVGTDIPEGEYLVLSISTLGGYFCVSSDANQDDIIFNDNFDTNSTIMVYDNEYLELSGSVAIPLDEFYSKHTIRLSNTGVMLRVGYDIEPGEYKLIATDDSGYYCIYDNTRQDDIIANDNFDNSSYVEVREGQYLILSRCVIEE